MRKRMFLAIIMGLLLLNVVGCSERQVKLITPNTPFNAAFITRNALVNGNYSLFNSLLSEGRKNSISEQEFNEIRRSTSTEGAGYTSYQLVKFQNGKALLIRLTQEKDEKGNYSIEDVKIVPEESMGLFAP